MTLEGKLFFSKLQYLGIAPLPVFWLLFTLSFSGNGGWVTPRRAGQLLIVPAVTLLLVATAGFHDLIYTGVSLEPSTLGTNLVTERGAWFWVHTAYSYALLLFSSGVLVTGFMGAARYSKFQYGTLLLVSSFPLVANALFLAGVDLLNGIDPTPVGFSLSCLFAAPLLVRNRVFDLKPVARRVVLETLPVGVIVVDKAERVVDINPAALELFGTTKAVVGRPFTELAPGWGWLLEQETAHSLLSTTLNHMHRHLDVRVTPLQTTSDAFAGRVLMVEDKTQQHSFEQMAYHDALTGLPNRRLLELEARHALDRAQLEGQTVALLYLDLDKFKPVNDTFGHKMGDLLLQQVTNRLQGVSRATDFLARLGGDEFVLLAPHIAEDEALSLARRMVDKLKEPYALEGNRVTLGGSVGVAFFPKDAADLDKLIACADTAMYTAKLVGSSVQSYERGEP